MLVDGAQPWTLRRASALSLAVVAADPAFVLVDLGSIDGRDDLRFPSTHPVLYQFFVDTFRRLSTGPLGPDCAVSVAVGDS